jgi:hypothetical protein
MASITVNLAPTIVSGTAEVYALADWPAWSNPSGSPSGSMVTSETVGSSGAVTFSGLTAGTTYVAYQGSPDRYVRFTVPVVEGGSSPDVSAVYSTVQAVNAQANALGAATYVLLYNSSTPQTAVGGQAARGAFNLDPADFAVSGKTAKLRLAVAAYTNATASTSTFDLNLIPVTALAGGAGVTTVTFGTPVSPTLTLTTPAASTMFREESDLVDFPVAGNYAIGLVITGAMAAGSSISITATLQVTYV